MGAEKAIKKDEKIFKKVLAFLILFLYNKKAVTR